MIWYAIASKQQEQAAAGEVTDEERQGLVQNDIDADYSAGPQFALQEYS